MDFFSIVSGSSGNCIVTGDDSTHVLIDAGLSGKRIEAGMNARDYTTSDMNALLITHEHSDHIAGVGVLARRYGMPIYATAGTIAAMKRMKYLGAIDESLFHIVRPDEPFSIGTLMINPIRISHDAAEPVGYEIISGQGDSAKRVAVCTDLGEYTDYTVDRLQGLDVLLLEANHDIRMLETGPYPYELKMRIRSAVGHLSNEDSGQLLSNVLHDDMKKIFLGHLSQENNYPDLAYEAVRMEVTMSDNKYKASDFDISVASRYEVSEKIVF